MFTNDSRRFTCLQWRLGGSRLLGDAGVSFWALALWRASALLRKIFSFVYKVLYKLVQILTGIELPCEVNLGHNFVIDHFGGIVISGYAQFGDDCRIRNGVVVGLKHVHEPIAPVIGNNVDIGAGAKLLGNIRIGNNVVIGANAVVLTDVPLFLAHSLWACRRLLNQDLACK